MKSIAIDEILVGDFHYCLKSWHRGAATLLAKGYSMQETAERLNIAREDLDRVSQQKFFVDLVSTELRTTGNFQEFLQGAAVDTFLKLIQLRDAPGLKPSTRLSVIREILDRTLGKPVQGIKQIETGENNSLANEDIDMLNEQLKRLQDHR